MNPLGPYVHASLEQFKAERPSGAAEDVHLVSSLADHVITRCSKPGDLVIDPFAGYGAALHRATMQGRTALGVELLPERVEYITQHYPQVHMVEGDARELTRLTHQFVPQLGAEILAGSDSLEGKVGLSFTSPPFMTANEHPANPLTAYEVNNANYRIYLEQIADVGAQVAQLLKPGGYAVWNVANIRFRGLTTTLAWDMAMMLSRSLHLLGETTVVWDELPHDFTGDYLLCFTKV